MSARSSISVRSADLMEWQEDRKITILPGRRALPFDPTGKLFYEGSSGIGSVSEADSGEDITSGSVFTAEDDDDDDDDAQGLSRSLILAPGSAYAAAHRLSLAIDPSATEQIQMLSDFLDLHFSVPKAKASLLDRQSHLLALPDIDTSSNQMLSDALRAICLGHIGEHHHDDRLVQQSQIYYGNVLRGLAQLVPRQDTKIPPADIVTCILLLCVYADYTPMPHLQSNAWKVHYWGAHEFLKAKGPSILSVCSPWDVAVYRNIKVPTFFIGIANRRAIIWTEPEWLDFSDTSIQVMRTKVNRSRSMFDRVVKRLPQLLEHSDVLLSKKGQQSADTAERLLHDLLSYLSTLQQLLQSDSAFAEFKSWKDSVETSQPGQFNDEVEEHVVLVTNHTFQRFHRFPTPMSCTGFTLSLLEYWLFGLIVECTILRILHFLPSAEAHLHPATGAQILRHAQDSADHLCKSVYSLSQVPSQGMAGFLDTCMALVENFYSEIGASAELGWVLAIRCATALRVERMRKSQPRTLCRMGDLADEIGASGRFRMRDLGPGG
ncbi:hypothetical protein BDY17DRAFT_290268 [Neohortaea acidophila]|uniref:Fungal-specific transcription factor domain-containing protein n=1 Tax=Neohortaea acidophila TaxID=245834 RepID=A0A6A6Q9N4_9PEZI|nr:uncharacterized protein BDY17DRAFT_290268 [Neohortaea acidophila]KAF2488117.1 hypothetical protein BDY17DRAFT_290268 [Neohortaea acidophila]